VIEDYVAIRRLQLPPGWEQERSDAGPEVGRAYRAPGHPQAGMFFRVEPRPTPPADALAFVSILAAPPHQLTPSEIKSIAGILREAGDPDVCANISIGTRDLGGRRVLQVEGRWLERQWDNLRIYVDVHGNGSAIQEIYYGAPRAVYPEYLPVAKECLSSLELRTLPASVKQ
jgi:hypothetical protein